MLPSGCLPLWGERGLPSWLPQKISELQEKEDFNTAGKTKKILLIMGKYPNKDQQGMRPGILMSQPLF